MRVLITRPAEDAEPLAAAVRARGDEPIIAPLSIIRHESANPPPERPAATIFTSRNAVRALCDAGWARKLHRLPAYCVGAATAQAARQAGFLHVIAGGGTGAQLAEYIAYTHRPGNGPMLYLTGDHLAFDMQEALGARGFKVVREVVYRSELVKSFPPEALALLESGGIDAVTLMSPRAARHFTHLSQQAGIAGQTTQLHFLCLSAPIAEALAPLSPDRIKIARQPSQAALLDLLGPSNAA